VNAIAPGPVATELFLTGKSDELVSAIKRMNPFGRLGTPEDIARVVAFLEACRTEGELPVVVVDIEHAALSARRR
jgi:3-oxoacyl-[acyl-carrier protein] reductase